MTSINDQEYLKPDALQFNDFEISDLHRTEDDKVKTSGWLRCLDNLSLCMSGNLDFEFDSTYYYEAPDFDYNQLYKRSSEDFLTYKFYNYVNQNSDSNPAIIVYDAIVYQTDT